MVRRSLLAIGAAAVVCLEPLAHAADGASVGFRGVWAAEVAAGLALALLFAAAARRRRRPSA